MASYNVELNNKPGKSGLRLLLLRITKDRKHKRVALGRHVKLKDFNKGAKHGAWIRSSSPQAKSLNELISNKIEEFRHLENGMEIKGEFPSVGRIAQAGKSGNSRSFTEFARKEIARHKAQGQLRTSVKKTHLISKVLESNGHEDFTFSDLDVTFVKEYETYWLSQGNKINTVQTDLKGIRAIVKSAIQEGLLTSYENPFTKYRIKSEKTLRGKLTEDEIKSLETVRLKKGSIHDHARNMFLFAFYAAGMRFSDVLQLRWRHIKGERVEYVMDKTQDAHNVLLAHKAKQLLKIYGGSKINQGAFIFPFFNLDTDYSDPEFLVAQISSKNALVNKYLKKVAKKAKVDTKISFHISRHSFAYQAVRKTGDLYSVSKSLNHKRLETTQTYLKQSDNAAVDAVITRVFG